MATKFFGTDQDFTDSGDTADFMCEEVSELSLEPDDSVAHKIRDMPTFLSHTENWQPYAGKYEVSDSGRVHRISKTGVRTELTQEVYKSGHRRVSIKGKMTPVAICVLEAFVGKQPTDKYTAHFKDGDKSNCKLSNLEWRTEPSRWGCGSKKPRLTDDILEEIKVKTAGGYSLLKVSESLGLSTSTVSYHRNKVLNLIRETAKESPDYEQKIKDASELLDRIRANIKAGKKRTRRVREPDGV